MRAVWMAAMMTFLAAGCGGGDGDSGGGAAPPAAVDRISVSPAELTLARGDATQLRALLHDGSGKQLLGRTVSWSSDDASKVDVTTGGVVRALGAGSAKVTATAEGKSASAQITVVEPVGVVRRVILNVVSEVLEEGANFPLEATALDESNNVLPGRVVNWRSSDAGTASVAPDGVVTGLRPGIVSVTATVDGQTAAATIRVFAAYGFELLYSTSYVETPETLYLLDISDPAGVPLPVFGPGKSASHAAPSPDGTRIAFVVHGAWDGTYWQSMIFVADRDGANAQRLTYLPARNLEPAWSPDGMRIAFSSQVFGEPAEIWVMDADGSNLVNLTLDQPNASKYGPAWSPPFADGSHRIAYALESGGASALWTMRADGGDKRAITSDARFYDSEPSWSPDGGTIVFQRTGDAIFGDLYLVASNGGAGRALMPANPLAFGQFGPVFSPDGRLIVFTSKHADGSTYHVWTVWADGTRLAQRTQESLQHADPAWILRP